MKRKSEHKKHIKASKKTEFQYSIRKTQTLTRYNKFFDGRVLETKAT